MEKDSKVFLDVPPADVRDLEHLFQGRLGERRSTRDVVVGESRLVLSRVGSVYGLTFADGSSFGTIIVDAEKGRLGLPKMNPVSVEEGQAPRLPTCDEIVSKIRKVLEGIPVFKAEH